MRNFKLINNPHEHFATFWKQDQDESRQLADLQQDLIRAAGHVQEKHAFSHFATIEVVSPLFPKTPEESSVPSSDEQAPSADKPQIYWLVSGDVVEVALIACRMAEQIGKQQELAQQQERERMAQLYADQE